VSSHPKIAYSYIVKMLEGISGRWLMMRYPELKQQLWKGNLLNSTFYIETIGSVKKETV
jgi:putative transposase